MRKFEFAVSELVQLQQDKFKKETGVGEEGTQLNRSEQESKGQMEKEATVDKDAERNEKEHFNDVT